MRSASRAAALATDRTIFLVEAFHRADGRRLWQYRLEAAGSLPGVHDKHNLASPSPVSDGQMVYAWFGTGQIVALDMNGKLVWQRHLGTEISPFDVIWGHSSSPTLFGDTLILLCDHEPASYLLAVDKRTGKRAVEGRPRQGPLSYSTPLVVKTPTGPELIVNSSERVDAYDPAQRHAAVVHGRHQPVSDSDAGLPRRRHLHEPRLSQQSLHGDSSGRPRRRLEVARRVGVGDRSAVHLVARASTKG